MLLLQQQLIHFNVADYATPLPSILLLLTDQAGGNLVASLPSPIFRPRIRVARFHRVADGNTNHDFVGLTCKLLYHKPGSECACHRESSYETTTDLALQVLYEVGGFDPGCK